MGKDTKEPAPDDPKKAPSNDTKEDWIERLAQRSTGLPETSQAKPQPKQASPWTYAGMGVQFAGTAVVFAVMGYYLDQHMHWSPWGTIVCTMIGLIGGFYLMIKEAFRINK